MADRDRRRLFRLAEQARESGGYQEKRLRCILCFADEGHPPRTEQSVAKELGVSRSAVRAWRSCFEKRGLQSLLAMHRATDATHSPELAEAVDLALMRSATPTQFFLRRRSLADEAKELNACHGLKVSPQFLATRRRRQRAWKVRGPSSAQPHEDAQDTRDELLSATPKEKRAKFVEDILQDFDAMFEEQALISPNPKIKWAIVRCAKIYGVSRMTIYRWLKDFERVAMKAQSAAHKPSIRPPRSGPHTRTLTGAYPVVYLGWLSACDTSVSTFSMPYAICFRATGGAELVAPKSFPDERVFTMGEFLKELRERGLNGASIFACKRVLLQYRRGYARSKEERAARDAWLKSHPMKTKEKVPNDGRPWRLLGSEPIFAPGTKFIRRFEHIEKRLKGLFPKSHLVYTDGHEEEAAKIWATRPSARAQPSSAAKLDRRIDLSGKFQFLTQRLQEQGCRDKLKRLQNLVLRNPQKYKPLAMVWHRIPEHLEETIHSWIRGSNARSPQEIKAGAEPIRRVLESLRDSVGDPVRFGAFFGERHGVDSEIRQEVRRYFKNCILKLNAAETAACKRNTLELSRLPRGIATRLLSNDYQSRIDTMWGGKKALIERMAEESPMGRVAYFEGLRTLRDAERMLNSKRGFSLFTDPV